MIFLTRNSFIREFLSETEIFTESDAVSLSEDAKDATTKTVGISHCNNRERAEFVKQEILKRVPFKECVIVNTAGVATLYANDGGIIVSY